MATQSGVGTKRTERLQLSAIVSNVSPTAVAVTSALESRLLKTRIIAFAVVGAVLGAIVGAAAFLALGSDTTATAFVRLQNPADLAAIAGGADQITPDNQGNLNTFVAGEIAYLSGDGFAQSVTRRLARDKPVVLDIAQADESAVVTISNTSASDVDAIRTVQTAIDLYREKLEQRVDEQLRIILPTLDSWQRRDSGDAVRTQELQRLRENVELQADQAANLTVVQPPVPEQPAAGQWMLGAIAGAVIGGIAAATIVLVLRKRSGRGSVAPTTAEVTDGVLLPAVDLAIPPRDAWGDEELRLARALYAQIPSTGPRTIVVAGASASSGSAVIASLLEAGAHEIPTGTTSATKVIAVGPVGDTPEFPDIVAAATDVVLVAQLEAESISDVLALRSATAASPVPTVAVFTYHRAPWPKSRKHRRKSRQQAAVPPNSTAGQRGEV